MASHVSSEHPDFAGLIQGSPHVDTRYEEFDNGSGGRVGVLIVKPDPDLL
jgi:hypothetical protein